MLFMVSSRARAEATREQLIEHLTRRLDPATWDLIRQGVVSHVLYKKWEKSLVSSRFSPHPTSSRRKLWPRRAPSD